MMRFWNRAEQTIVGVLGLTALAFALWQIVSRYFFPQGAISYAEEVIVYLMIWAIMIVSSQLVDTDGHVRPDLVFNIAPGWLLRWMEMFSCTAAIMFCGALAWYGLQIVQTARQIEESSASDLRFPMWIYYAALPAGSALMTLRFAIRLAAIVRSPKEDLAPHPGG